MGGRGGSSGFSVVSQLRNMKTQGKFPTALFGGNSEQRIEAFKGIDKVFSYPADLEQFMQEKYANGIPKVKIHETEPGRIYATFDGSTIGVNYPIGKTDSETAKIKAGAEKFLFINQWNKRKKRGET